MKTTMFAAKFPERSFNFGIAEQNMMAAAAGMATTGLIPFANTYAVFASMRALDQVRNSIHYPRLNVKIAASHSGITPGPDGVTHQAQEDLSIMRSIAGSTVIAPADPTSTRMAVHAAAAYEGPVYLSFTRDPVPVLYDESFPFRIGKAVVVREGKDAAIVANRDLVVQALIAAELLARKGIDVRVIDCHTLKPLDEQTVLKAARDTGRHRHGREQHHLRRPGQRGGRGAGGETPHPDAADRRAGHLRGVRAVPRGDRQVRADRAPHRQGRERSAQAQAGSRSSRKPSRRPSVSQSRFKEIEGEGATPAGVAEEVTSLKPATAPGTTQNHFLVGAAFQPRCQGIVHRGWKAAPTIGNLTFPRARRL